MIRGSPIWKLIIELVIIGFSNGEFMLPRLDFDLLRTFATVAETGNLTRAGERLLLSQPTVSLQIKRLEDQLGCSLMERTPRSLSLTSEGETLLSYARRILALADEAVAR